mgnify:CR=1 FL=1
MRLSTKGQYALEAMVALAVAGPGVSLSIREIAGRTGVSQAYLEQIFSNLRRDGLLESVRGTQGGYLLARAADSITVSDVLESGEGSLAPVHCAESGQPVCDEYETCMTRALWDDMSKTIRTVTDHLTLADIVSAWQENGLDDQPDFSI